MNASKFSAIEAAKLTLGARNSVYDPIIDAIKRKASIGGTSVKTKPYCVNDNLDQIFHTAITPLLTRDGFKVEEVPLNENQKQLEISWEHLLENNEIELPEFKNPSPDRKSKEETPSLQQPSPSVSFQLPAESIPANEQAPSVPNQSASESEQAASQPASVENNPTDPTPVSPEENDTDEVVDEAPASPINSVPVPEKQAPSQNILPINNNATNGFAPPVNSTENQSQWRLGQNQQAPAPQWGQNQQAPAPQWGQNPTRKPAGAYQVLPVPPVNNNMQ